mgnify:CR=1 FL=1
MLALVAFALGPDIDLESHRTSGSGRTTFPSSSAEVNPPVRGAAPRAIPWLRSLLFAVPLMLLLLVGAWVCWAPGNSPT